MARVVVSKTTVKGPYPTMPVSANALDLAMTAAQANGTPDNENYVEFRGKGLLIVQNTHATNAYTFTLNSAPDRRQRSGDLTEYSVGAGEIAAFLLKEEGWRQTNGRLHLEAENAAVKFGFIPLS
jgi:hypothetical protein